MSIIILSNNYKGIGVFCCNSTDFAIRASFNRDVVECLPLNPVAKVRFAPWSD